MTIHQTGDRYLLEGNSQSLFIDGLSKALVFIEGSNDNLFDDFSTNVTVAMFGHNDSIHQYGGNPRLTILGFNASDSLDLYGLLPNPNGTGFEPPRTPIIAANLHPDGHGGWPWSNRFLPPARPAHSSLNQPPGIQTGRRERTGTTGTHRNGQLELNARSPSSKMVRRNGWP